MGALGEDMEQAVGRKPGEMTERERDQGGDDGGRSQGVSRSRRSQVGAHRASRTPTAESTERAMVAT